MIRYVGAKSRLAAQIIPLFPAHRTYVEPFAGMARLLFAKPPSRTEILNDVNSEVVNYLRVCQLHHRELRRWLRFCVASRQMFELYRRQDPTTLTDVQRAVRFFYLQSTSFAGRVTGTSFGINQKPRTVLNGVRLARLLQRTARRLERVQLECRPYEQVLRRFDREETLFYCDPPYIGTRAYPQNFATGDYEQLADRLARLKARFLLSINDHPLARSIFGDFRCRELTVRYYANPRPESRPRVKELLFANFDLDRAPVVSTSFDRQEIENDQRT
jgi:DNA adenine methylase